MSFVLSGHTKLALVFPFQFSIKSIARQASANQNIYSSSTPSYFQNTFFPDPSSLPTKIIHLLKYMYLKIHPLKNKSQTSFKKGFLFLFHYGFHLSNHLILKPNGDAALSRIKHGIPVVSSLSTWSKLLRPLSSMLQGPLPSHLRKINTIKPPSHAGLFQA